MISSCILNKVDVFIEHGVVFFFPNIFRILLGKLNVLRLVNRTALAVLALLRHKVRIRQFVVVFSIDRIVVPNFGIAAHH